MKAYIKTIYGGPEVLQLKEVDQPKLKDQQIRVKVVANSANPADWHLLRGKPFLSRLAFGIVKPKNKIPGIAFAGIVEEIGEHVEHIQIGDCVFGESDNEGAFAEYICVPEKDCAIMPEGVDFPSMACVPVAGITAFQALITHGKLCKGESVLINGSSGGVGHFAIQIAKAKGAIVTAVCSSRNVDFMKKLGADFVIPYDKQDIHQHHQKYDLIVDVNGNLFQRDFKRMGHRGVLVGFTTLGHLIAVLLKNAFSKFPLIQFTAKVNSKDLETLASFIQSGSITVEIEKTFSYREIPEAIRYIETMRTRGKVVMLWEENAYKA